MCRVLKSARSATVVVCYSREQSRIRCSTLRSSDGQQRPPDVREALAGIGKHDAVCSDTQRSDCCNLRRRRAIKARTRCSQRRQQGAVSVALDGIVGAHPRQQGLPPRMQRRHSAQVHHIERVVQLQNEQCAVSVGSFSRLFQSAVCSSSVSDLVDVGDARQEPFGKSASILKACVRIGGQNLTPIKYGQIHRCEMGFG